MSFQIFYSWQSKTNQDYNKIFIQNALRDAIKELKKDIKEGSAFYIDRDTKDVPGFPNIPTTIEEKIHSCDLFIGDVTYVSYMAPNNLLPERTFWDKAFGINKPQKLQLTSKEGVSSPNVMQELGIAQGSFRGSERIITIMNTSYGTPDKLNFDSAQYRHPITYNFSENSNVKQLEVEKKKLIEGLKERIRLIYRTEHEREKEYYVPFITWKTWDKVILKTFRFEYTEYVVGILTTLKKLIISPKTIIRFCGLSGIGKTRMIYQCFINADTKEPEDISNNVLYIDLNEYDDKIIIKASKELLLKQERKVLIVDNCSKDLHNYLTSIISNRDSKLSLITISTDPEERINELDHDQNTQLIILDSQQCKKTVEQILRKNFTEFQEDEQLLLIDFSSGLSLVATLMAQNPDRGKYQPGTLTKEDVIKRLLGPFYSDKDCRAAIYACSLFSNFGYFDDLSFQSEKIAANKDIFEIDETGINADDLPEWRLGRFKEYCEALRNRQLLEKRGRTFSFRPSPLAVRMAEGWWKNCTMSKFQRILPFLKEAQLVDSFCEQFKYLKHVENAKTIVKDLCGDFFSFAEVLNTYVGSRLFRSFVYVNPVACTSALTKAFLELPKNEMEKIDEGRRNLVWALEKLCFRPETFIEATKVMAAFAIAENENIGNNSTNQFLQLFHIYLPGTAVNLEERWKLIEYCFQQNDDLKQLGVKSLGSAISVSQFGRMGGAEDQGDSIPLQDYKPSGKEIYSYWQIAIALLEQIALDSVPLKQQAITILKDSFYGLCAHGAGKLIIPVIKNLLHLGFLDRMETRSQIQFIMNSGRVSDRESYEELLAIFNELAPVSFAEKFRILIKQPPADEYAVDGKYDASGGKIGVKIDEFTTEFLEHIDKLDEYSRLFVSGRIAEGYNFGKYISQKADPIIIEAIVTAILGKLKSTLSEERNISILLGILVYTSEKEYARTIFYRVLDDKELKTLAFDLVRSISFSAKDIFYLLEETEKGKFTSNYFQVFNYGWGLQHLPTEETTEIINRIRKLDSNGKVVAFFILSTWANDTTDVYDKFKGLIRDSVLLDSTLIFGHIKNSMDVNYYTNVVLKLLTDSKDEELATSVIKTIIDQSNKPDDFYSKEFGFIKILNILEEQYFPILWAAISKMYLDTENYGLAAFNFKSLLGSRHDFQSQSNGILFKDNPQNFDIIFQWCKNHRGIELYWISELLPLFDEERNVENDWHPYAKKFIDEFGDDKNFLGSISANLGIFSWTGSVVPKLASDKALFEKLLTHRFATVREWAQINISDLDNRIKWEKDKDEDGIIPAYTR